MPESLTFCGRTFRADELELMRQMAREFPITLEELAQIPHVGLKRANDFGVQFLGELQDHVARSPRQH